MCITGIHMMVIKSSSLRRMYSKNVVHLISFEIKILKGVIKNAKLVSDLKKR